MSSIDDVIRTGDDTDWANVPDPSSNSAVTMTKEQAKAKRDARGTVRPRTSTPKRKAIAGVNKNAKTLKKDQPKRIPFKDSQWYILIRGKGKGTYATVRGTEALRETAMHGYASSIYKLDAQGNPTGKNLIDRRRTFKNGKMTFYCPEH
jgi:hypothetical protein